jgi:transcriptional regulator with GAF, ATPase, and Fis domain
VSGLEADMDDSGTLTMSTKELNRLEILGRVLERRLTQAQAAEQLGLGVRQVERLCRKLRTRWAPRARFEETRQTK